METMKRIGSLTKKRYQTSYDDDQEDDSSMQSESIYTKGAGSTRKKLETDDDDDSVASSIASNGLFLDLDGKMHVVRVSTETNKKESITYDDDTYSKSNNSQIDSSVHDIESNSNPKGLDPLDQKKRRVSETTSKSGSSNSGGTAATTSEDGNCRNCPLAGWYRNSSKRFKFTFFATLTLLIVFLVLLVLLLVSDNKSLAGSGGESNNNDLDGNMKNAAGAKNPVPRPQPLPQGPASTPNVQKAPTSSPGSASPSCQDSEETFLLQGVQLTCEWLSGSTAGQLTACEPDGVAYNVCQKTCKNCD